MKKLKLYKDLLVVVLDEGHLVSKVAVFDIAYHVARMEMAQTALLVDVPPGDPRLDDLALIGALYKAGRLP